MGKNPFIALFLLMLIFFSCQKEETPLIELEKGFLKGLITNEFKQPIEGATIEVDLGTHKIKTTSTESGSYFLGGVFPGERNVSVSSKTFIGQSKKILIEENYESILDFELLAGETVLEILKTEYQFNFEGEEVEINVKSNSTWNLESKVDWISLSTTSGNGNGNFILSIKENKDLDFREALIKLSSGELIKEIKVSQISKSVITSSIPLLGYQNLGSHDTITVKFNNPVRILSIEADFHLCSPNFPFQFQYSQERKSVSFEYDCGDPGQAYSFQLKYEDDFGNVFTEKFETLFYDRKIELEGYVHRTYYSLNENSIWILTYSKNILYKVNLDNFRIEKRFEFQEIPDGFAINDLKKEIFLYYLGKNYIDVFEENSFFFKTRIEIQKETSDHPDHPVIYPYNLQFLNSGIGVLSLASNSSSALKWKILDSNNGYKISSHSQSGGDVPNQIPVADRIIHNYDRSKLFIMSNNNYHSFAVFDQKTNHISVVRSKYEFYPVDFMSNRKNNYVILLQNYVQSVIDPVAGNELMNFDLPSFFSKGTDFAYHPNKPLLTFYYKKSSLYLLDYSIGELREVYMRFNEITSIFSSTNGDNLFLIRNTGNPLPSENHYYTEIFNIPTNYFLDY